MDGQFAIQEYIQQLIRTSSPSDRRCSAATAGKDPSDIATICKCPKGHDANVWILEHLRSAFPCDIVIAQPLASDLVLVFLAVAGSFCRS